METRGYKSTEFWLSLVAMLVGAFMAAGFFDGDHPAMKLAGMATSVLAALGYTAGRSYFKSNKLKADTLREAGKPENP